MMVEIINGLFFQSIARIWPWLRIKIYSKDEFKKDIEIDVRSSNPLTFILNCDIPHVALYIEINNKSQYLELTIEKIFFEIWIKSDRGIQPVIYQGKMIAHPRVGKKEMKTLYWTSELNCYQTEFLKARKDSKDLSATLHIDYDINSKIYEITNQINLENRQCKIEGN